MESGPKPYCINLNCVLNSKIDDQTSWISYYASNGLLGNLSHNYNNTILQISTKMYFVCHILECFLNQICNLNLNLKGQISKLKIFKLKQSRPSRMFH